MKLILPFLLSLFLIVAGNSGAQCTVSITTADQMVCTWDTVTLTAFATGPDNQLQASTSAGNNHRGNMFDIVAANSVTITSFDASPMGNTTIEIYYKVGTWNGFANTPSAWTFIGSAPVTATGSLVPVPVPVNITIPAGQTYAFYVTSNTQSVSLNYTDGTGVGNVFSSDANISFIEGGGMEYPFTANTGGVFQPRVWNGNIHYSLANIPGATYSWNTGEITENIQPVIIAATSYSVEATIPGCPAMHDTLDIATSVPAVSAGDDFAVCPGQAVMLFATGTPAAYSWDNGITDSVAFTPAVSQDYAVTATDSIGCMVHDTVSVEVYPFTPVSIPVDTENACSGDTVILQANDAVTYSWSNGVVNGEGFVPDSSGAVSVTGVDVNGCISYDTLIVTILESPVVYAGVDTTFCAGSEVIFSGSGADIYVWTDGVINGMPFIPVAGTYMVTGTDTNGCVDTDEITVSISSIDAPIASNGPVLVTAINPDGTQWVNCSDWSAVAGETGPIFTASLTGSYAVVLTNSLGCVDTSDCMLVDFAAIDELSSATLSVSPVPTNGSVTILSSGAVITRIELIDLLGNLLLAEEPNALQTNLDLSAYPASQFFVRVHRANSIELVRVVKN